MMTPECAEASKATQFVPGNDAQKKGKPWSIRNQMRYLAAQEIDSGDAEAFKARGRMTRAQLIALKALEKASEGDVRAIEHVTDNIDGKLPQANINADLQAIQNMSSEELDALIEENENIIRELTSKDPAGDAPDGENPPPGGETGNA